MLLTVRPGRAGSGGPTPNQSAERRSCSVSCLMPHYTGKRAGARAGAFLPEEPVQPQAGGAQSGPLAKDGRCLLPGPPAV